MGNTVVWKPSELSPTGPSLAAKIFAKSLPDGVLNVVFGGAEIGQQLVSHDGVDAIGFIGSTAVGHAISQSAGVKRLLLELGGNGPLIVARDADLHTATDAAVAGCFTNAGQLCVSSERILVDNAVRPEFVAMLATKVRRLVMGDPFDEATQVGPLSSETLAAGVQAQVDDAVGQGASILCGGTRDGLWFTPTVLDNVSPEMLVATEETFGPVAPIIGFDTISDAIELANRSQYGLQAAVFTSSLETAWRVGEELECGSVNVNMATSAGEMNAPFGGVKQSGHGRVLGPEGLKSFSSVKAINFRTRTTGSPDEAAADAQTGNDT